MGRKNVKNTRIEETKRILDKYQEMVNLNEERKKQKTRLENVYSSLKAQQYNSIKVSQTNNVYSDVERFILQKEKIITLLEIEIEERAIRIENIQNAIAVLNKELRKLISLKYIYKKSIKQISQELYCDRRTIERKLNMAIELISDEFYKNKDEMSVMIDIC
jgi:DNA-directed RNA polymerase specialized sigma24 family protein